MRDSRTQQTQRPRESLGSRTQRTGDASLSDELTSAANQLQGLGTVLKVISLSGSVVRVWTTVGDELAELYVRGAGEMDVLIEGYGATQSPPTTATTPPTTATTVPSGSLSVSFTENPFVCDSGLRQFGTVSGAQPGERITFTSPQLGTLVPGTAKLGRETHHPMGMRPTRRRRLLASHRTGHQQQPNHHIHRHRQSRHDNHNHTTANNHNEAASGVLVGVVHREPVRVRQRSPPVRNRKRSAARREDHLHVATTEHSCPEPRNSAGRLTIQWECDPPDAGDSWQVTARGTSSNRTTTFTVTGRAATTTTTTRPPTTTTKPPVGSLSVSFTENPFGATAVSASSEP